MNVTSLEHLVPCGGDDLAAVEGDLTLRQATGTQRYRPLGSARSDSTRPTPASRSWRTKGARCGACDGAGGQRHQVLADPTTTVALNLDLMGSVVSLEEAQGATEGPWGPAALRWRGGAGAC